MAETQGLISSLQNASNLNTATLIEVAQEDLSSQTGYTSRKATFSDVADTLLNETQYQTELKTRSKTIIGAINEAYEEGGGGGGGGGGDVTKAYLEEHYYDKVFFKDISTVEVTEETGKKKVLEESDKIELMNYINTTVNGLNEIIGSGVI